mmetsp:Transcript_9441/g.22289  ORF Transcript_9441/g.22289 Transcript_9441/m.22289 type:complete len:206 (+) Transcript_9441:756-1373(+)
MAQRLEEVLVLVEAPGRPPWHPCELRQEHLLVQLELQASGDLLQKMDFVLLQPDSRMPLFPDDLPNLAIEIRRQIPLRKESEEQGVLMELLHPRVSICTHRGGQRANEGGEHSHRQQDHKYCEEPLDCILWSDVVRCRRELCQGPVYGCGVVIQGICLLHLHPHDPAPAIDCPAAEAVPNTCDEVVHRENTGEASNDLHDHERVC